MRFQLNLKVTETFGEGLPINYQSIVAKWLFDIIKKNDRNYLSWLQSKGMDGKGRIMMLTFSRFFLDLPQVVGDRLQFDGTRIKLLMGLHIPGNMQLHVVDLFTNMKGKFEDEKGGIAFEVEKIYRQYDILIKEEMQFRTVSPVFLTVKNPTAGNVEHIGPEHAAFRGLLFENLCHKYNSFLGSERAHQDFHPKDFQFELLNKPTEKLMVVFGKDGSQTKLKVFDFEMKITAPKPLMMLALNLGIGKSNSLGFGMIEATDEEAEA